MNRTAVRRGTQGLLAAWTAMFRPVLVILLVLVPFLALLAYVETVWLPRDMPRDSAARVALVVFPEANGTAVNGAGMAPLQGDWSKQLMHEASGAALMQDLIAKLDLRDTAGEPLSAQQLSSTMLQGSQCIELTSADGREVSGLLVYNVVRGPDSAVVEDVAREWSHLFIQRSSAELPPLVVQPVESLGTPYRICQKR